MSYLKVSDTVRRKADHIRAALEEDVQFHTITPGFERLRFSHEALPELDRSEIDTSITLLGKQLSVPLIISSMTGGTREAALYNRRLAEAAQWFGAAMGVGSQRVAIENPGLADTFQVRDVAPDILLFANLGAVQLNNGCGLDDCRRAVEMIGANALMLHINPLQESIQANGNTNFRGLAERIAKVCSELAVPVIVKEVGHGISGRTARLLVEAGVAGIDVAGAGGTSWAKVECRRTEDAVAGCVGESLGEWGIPTVDSLQAVKQAASDRVVIASGGVRSGEDIAKCMALGADAAGVALPLLQAAADSNEALHSAMTCLREELVTVMFCLGARTIVELRECKMQNAE